MSSQDNIIWQKISNGWDFTVVLRWAKPVLLPKMPFIYCCIWLVSNWDFFPSLILENRYICFMTEYRQKALMECLLKDLGLSLSPILDNSFVFNCWMLHANTHTGLHYLHAHQNCHLPFAASQPILMHHSFCPLGTASSAHLQQQPPSALPPVELYYVQHLPTVQQRY